jgi:hypothetical protein
MLLTNIIKLLKEKPCWTGISYSPRIKANRSARHWWLTPVILATWETEVRRIVVRGQPRQIVHKTISQKYSKQNRADGVAPVVDGTVPP